MALIHDHTVHIDCLHFKGDIPCKPHKNLGYHCSSCPVYEPISKRVLIIKLGAIGDVIRTTPLLRRFRLEYPGCSIHWLTLTPDILPKQEVDEILPFNLSSVTYLQNASFDILVNLDKDKEACSLARAIHSTEKFGYTLKHGKVFPMNDLAEQKFLTGLFDDVSKNNTKSYVQEIFDIMGWAFQGEEYVFEDHQDKGFVWSFPSDGKRIGLNTGCGDRWTTRLWPDDKWIDLISLLQQKGFIPVLLGGKQEDAKNSELAKRTGAYYPGYFSLPQFINLVNQMDVVVTQVTMAMHISVALKKKTVLMNNIFNPHEFELYGRGVIIQPETECVCYFQGNCKKGESCMKDLHAEKVFSAVLEQI
jgi:ADP-heptose:LPS heptosyltransferase